MKIIFVGYNYLPEFNSPAEWIDRIKPLAVVMEALGQQCTVIYIGHINYTGNYSHKNVQYCFLDCHKKKPRFPFRLHRFIKNLRPDIVIIPGLHFPLQLLQLRFYLGKKTGIIARHHADRPFSGLKKIAQRLADRVINAYLFSSFGNAQEWLDAGIIRNKNKIYEIPAASTYFSRLDKEAAKQHCQMTGEFNFLWVGRLNENKDPMTVLDGFEKYVSTNPRAKLHMIYQTEDLLPGVTKKTEESTLLRNAVTLHGYIPYDELPEWYSAADFFISGSHREASGYAAMEAMACGCIPLVTAIPASMKMIAGGKYGFYYQAGNPDDLFRILLSLAAMNRQEFSTAVEKHFKEALSAEAIAGQLFRLSGDLITK